MRATTAATLALTSLLFHRGHGFSSNQIQAPAKIFLQRIQARLAHPQPRLQDEASQKTSQGSIGGDNTTINGTTSFEGLGIHITNLPAGEGDSDQSNEEIDGKGRIRQLQSSCASGTSFNILSSVFPLMEGCHVASTDTTGNEAIYVGTASSVSAFTASEDAYADFYWVAVYADSDDELVIACAALEMASTVHPADASWYCDVNGDRDIVLPTSTQFSTTCGCNGDGTTPAPIPVIAVTAPSVSPTSPYLTPGTGGTCIAGDSFLVSSSVWPDIEGCYKDTGYLAEDEIVYTMTATTDLGQMWIFAYAPYDSDPSTILWALVYLTETSSSSQFMNHCFSNEVASSYHPADVVSWWCDETESGTYSIASSAIISVDCGCDETAPTPVTSIGTPHPSVPEPTQGSRGVVTSAPMVREPDATTPSPSATVVDTLDDVTEACGESDQFRITSSQAPEIQECYQAVDDASSFDGEVYSVTGTRAAQQMFVVPSENDGETLWWILFFSSGDAEESVLYCTSLEDAAIVHPTDATWICDLDGDSEDNFVTVTDSQLSVDCGCDGTPSPVPPSTPTSPESPTTVNLPTTGSSTSGSGSQRHVSFAATAGAGALVVVTLVVT